MIYLLSAGIFGFLSMIAMLFFNFKPEENDDSNEDYTALKRN